MASGSESRYQHLKSELLGSNSQKLLTSTGPVGISVGIVAEEDTFFFSSGTLFKGSGSAINEDTLFEIGSITKTFTALLASLSTCEGAISPTAYMDDLLPASCKPGKGIANRVRITDLASHQSGLPNLANDQHLDLLLQLDEKQPFRAVDTQYVQQLLGKTKHLSGYGKYCYSNYAFALLGLILEEQAGMSYEDVLAARITTPLRMYRTRLHCFNAENQAGCYTQAGALTEPLLANKIAPAGGLSSTALDMVNYIRAQLQPDHTALGGAVALSHQPFCVADDFAVGLGWNIVSSGSGNYFEKTGDSFGNSSVVRFDKKNQVGFVILSNHQNSPLLAHIADQLYSSLLSRSKCFR